MASREENLRYLAGGSLPKNTGVTNGSSVTSTKGTQTDGQDEKARRREENLRYLATPAEDIVPKNQTVDNSSFTSKSGKFG